MLKRFAVFLLVFAGLGYYAVTSGGMLGGTSSATSTLATVVEFYHPGLDHFFITADEAEISALDNGILKGWTRTGITFTAFTAASWDASRSPVCRFYGRPEAGLDSHFYSGAPDECAQVLAKFTSSWQLESADVFQIQMPDRATGACSGFSTPVYRLFNNRIDANHRYTADLATKQAMLARGHTAEGYGPEGVAFCAVATSAPPPPPAPTATPPSVNIVVTPMASDNFSFTAIASAAAGAIIVSYAWNFGDGDSATGTATSHHFSVSGTFPVVVTVTDSNGAVATAVQNVASASTATPAPPTSVPTPTPTPPTTNDFDARKSAGGVVRWFDFDSNAQLGVNTAGANFGYFSNSGNVANLPVIDTNVKASGAGSLRFDVRSQSFPDAQWYANFSADLSKRFGANSTFYVQWRQRFNQAMVDTLFTEADGSAQGGIKQAILGPGDTPTKIWGSCEAIHLVTQTWYQHRLVQAYNSCSGSESHSAYAGLTSSDGSDYYFQNAMPTPFCSRSQAMAAGPTASPAGCFGWVANEWLTFQYEITLGPRTNDTAGADFANSTVKLWAAREGQPSVLLIDWKPGVGGYFPLAAGPLAEDQRYGKIWLLPYMTGKSATQAHALAQTWYDELIISTQRIPDPSAATKTIAPPPVAGTYPSWRQGKAAGTFFEIPNTAAMAGATNAVAATTDVWNGLAAGPTTWYSALASGHGEWRNALHKIDLAANAPRWSTRNAGSAFTAATAAEYYLDGLPTGRHTYWSNQYISAAHDRNGVDRVMVFGAYAAYGLEPTIPGTHIFDSLTVDGFNLATDKYDPAGTWSKLPSALAGELRSISKHPVTEDIYVGYNYALAKWTAATDTWTTVATVPPQGTNPGSGGLLAWNRYPSLVDGSRNRVVVLHDGQPYYYAGVIRMQIVDIASGAISELRLTGTYPTGLEQAGFVHDLDNDRYLMLDSSGKVYAINPTSGATSVIATVPAASNGVFNRFAYFKDLGGVAYLPQYASNIMFMPTR
jgi:PKD domain/Repeat of unknown function (DUF5648)